MAVQYVTLTLDLLDGSGAPLTQGTATFTPSQEIVDPGNNQILAGPVTSTFRAGSSPRVLLAATDTIGPQPNGWNWTVTFDSRTPGSPASFSFYLPIANGSSQRLSALAQVPVAQPGQQYLPLPSGTATAGLVPVASGSAESSAWGVIPGAKLATVVYAPATLTAKTISQPTLVAFDTTNLTISFVVPQSGKVTIEALATVQPSTATAKWCFGLLVHGTSTLVGTIYVSIDGSANTQSPRPLKWYLTGLTPGPMQLDLAGAISSGQSMTLACLGQTTTTNVGDVSSVGAPVVLEAFAA